MDSRKPAAEQQPEPKPRNTGKGQYQDHSDEKEVEECELLDQYQIEVPLPLLQSKVKIQNVFHDFMRDPGTSLTQHCRNRKAHTKTVMKLAKEQDWNGKVRRILNSQASEIMQRRCDEAAMALLADFGLLQEYWRTITVLRDEVFDENGEAREFVLDEETRYSENGEVISQKRKVQSKIPRIREYQKALTEFCDLRRRVTGLELMDKVKVSEAGQTQIVNNVDFGFGINFMPLEAVEGAGS